MKIAILNENRILRRTICAILKAEEYEVIVYSDAIVAIENLGKDLPDLFITELIISYKDGFSLVAEVRAIKEKYISLLVLSEMNQENSIKDYYAAGVDHFISTPIDFHSFLEVIASFFVKKLTHT